MRPELLVQHAINTAYSRAVGMAPEQIALSTVPPTAPPAPKLRIDLPYAVALRDLFARSIGKQLTGREIRRAADQAFGPGAGSRIRVACKRDGRRMVITELTIGLAGAITENASLAELIQNAPTTRPGCPAGIVDRPGFQ